MPQSAEPHQPKGAGGASKRGSPSGGCNPPGDCDAPLDPLNGLLGHAGGDRSRFELRSGLERQEPSEFPKHLGAICSGLDKERLDLLMILLGRRLGELDRLCCAGTDLCTRYWPGA